MGTAALESCSHRRRGPRRDLAGDVKRRLAPELFALVDADLEDLRAHGFELPDATQHYCRMRLNAGYLVHRTNEGRDAVPDTVRRCSPTILALDNLNSARLDAVATRLIDHTRLNRFARRYMYPDRAASLLRS